MPPPNFTTPNNHWKPWTRDDDDKLMHALWRHRRERKLSATEFWQMMAKTLDRGWQAVQWRCNAFQLRGDWSPLEAKAGDQDQPREAQHRASPSPSLGRKTDWTKEEDAQLVRLRRNRRAPRKRHQVVKDRRAPPLHAHGQAVPRALAQPPPPRHQARTLDGDRGTTPHRRARVVR